MPEAQPASSRYWLNRVVFDLGRAGNREAFADDRQAYLDRYPLDEGERAALLGPSWRALLDRGVLPNLVFKYYMIHGLPPEKFAETVREDGHG